MYLEMKLSFPLDLKKNDFKYGVLVLQFCTSTEIHLSEYFKLSMNYCFFINSVYGDLILTFSQTAITVLIKTVNNYGCLI